MEVAVIQRLKVQWKKRIACNSKLTKESWVRRLTILSKREIKLVIQIYKLKINLNTIYNSR